MSEAAHQFHAGIRRAPPRGRAHPPARLRRAGRLRPRRRHQDRHARFRAAVVRSQHFTPADPESNPTEGWDPFSGEVPASPGAFTDPIAAAHAAGVAEGRAAALAEVEGVKAREAALLDQVSTALATGAHFDRERMAGQLRQTVLHLVAKLVGEAGVAPDVLTARIAAAIDLLADSAESALLRLHPDDVPLVEGKLPATIFPVGDPAHRAWRLHDRIVLDHRRGRPRPVARAARPGDRAGADPAMLNRFTADYLEGLGCRDFAPKAKVSGRLSSFDGLLMEAVGLSLPVGTVCAVGTGAGRIEAEVIGFRGGKTC